MPLLWVARDARPRRAALLGLLAGIAYYGVVVSWAWYFGAVAIVPFVVVLACYWAAVMALLAALGRQGIAHPTVTAAVWVCGEGLVARWPLGGFSWGEVGYAMHSIAPMRSIGALGGLALVSFVVVLVNAVIAELIRTLRAPHRTAQWYSAFTARGVRAPAGGIIAIVVCTAIWFGAWPRQPSTGRMHVALLQGNNLDRYLTDAEVAARYLPTTHFELADRLHGRYDLVVFPESSLDATPIGDPYLESHIRSIAKRLHTFVLVNGVAELPDDRVSNQDVLYAPDGKVTGTYSKRHLVPFGEYVPWRSTLQPLIGALSQIPRDFAPGTRRGLETIAGHRVATVICFESAFGYQVRPLVHDGAQLIVVSTNNRSYRRSANSAQHVAISQMRAAETGRSVLHAAISGETAVIDDRGRVLTHTALFHNGITDAVVTTRSGQTPYVRFGEWVLELALVAVAVLAAVAAARQRRGPRDQRTGMPALPAVPAIPVVPAAGADS